MEYKMNENLYPSKSGKKIGGNKFDITKFILSIFIICLHSNSFPNIFTPIFRVAVPLFFIITSYFFFSKLKITSNNKERNALLFHYLKRNFFLLLFWSIIFIIPICIRNHWIVMHFPYIIYSIIKSIFIGSTFQGSWFISATIIATSIIYILCYKFKIKDRTLFVWCIVLYVICCMCSNYSHLIIDCYPYYNYYNIYRSWLGDPFCSFVIGIVWISFGKFLAYHKFSLSHKIIKCVVILSFILIYIEFFLIKKYLSPIMANDCYISLLLLCPTLILLIIHHKDIQIKGSKVLRKLSIIFYCTHGTFLMVLRQIMHVDLFYTIIVFILCFITGFCIIKYEKKYKILKYAT